MRPPPSPELRASVRAKVTASRAAQGLPPVITDPATLERVAAVLRLVTITEPAPRPHRVPGRKTVARSAKPTREGNRRHEST